MSTLLEYEIGYEFGFYHRIGADTDKKVIHILHSHPKYEIIYILSGSANYQVEGQFFAAECGDIIVINSNVFHCIMPNDDSVYERIVLEFDHRFLTQFGSGVDFFNCFDNYTKHTHCIITKQISKEYNFDAAFKKISYYSKKVCNENLLRLRCEVILMLLDISELFLSGPKTRPTHIDEVVYKTIDFINKNYTNEITLEVLAKKMFLSKYYLCHLFKERTGFSITSYIQNKRILAANDMIMQGQPATAAATAVGFNNYSNFYKAYQKIFNKSPSKH